MLSSSVVAGKTSAAVPEMSQQQQLKNFLSLKAKIIHTDELIKRYQEQRVESERCSQQVREARAHISVLEQGMVGLKAELQALHEEKWRLQSELTCCRQEAEVATARATNAELLVQQLSAQVEKLQCEQDAARVEELKKEVTSLQEEREKLWKRCFQLKDELKQATQCRPSKLVGGRRRRLSSASTLSLRAMSALPSLCASPQQLSPACHLLPLTSSTPPPTSPPSPPPTSPPSPPLAAKEHDVVFLDTDSAEFSPVERLPIGGSPADRRGDQLGGGDEVDKGGDQVRSRGDLVDRGGDLVGGGGDSVCCERRDEGDQLANGDDSVGGGGDWVGNGDDLVDGGGDLVGGGDDLVDGGGELVGGDQIKAGEDDCAGVREEEDEQCSVNADHNGAGGGGVRGDSGGVVGGSDGVVGHGDSVVGSGDGSVVGGGDGVVGGSDGVVGDGVVGGGGVMLGEGDGDSSLSSISALLPTTCHETETLSDLDLSVSECSSTCSDTTLADLLEYLEEEPCDVEETTNVPCQQPTAADPDLPPPSPPACPAPPSPPVHAAADTISSDTDSELSLSEVESLSPLPPSPHLRLPTLSPLPLSPQGQVLSPLPHSPAAPCHEPLEFVAVAPHHSGVCMPIPTPQPPPTDVCATHPHPTTLHRSKSSPFTAPLALQSQPLPGPSPSPPPPPPPPPSAQPVSRKDSPLPVESSANSLSVQAAGDAQPVHFGVGQPGGKSEVGTIPVEMVGETVSHCHSPDTDKDEAVSNMEEHSTEHQEENELEEGELVDSEGEGETRMEVGGENRDIQVEGMSTDTAAAAKPAHLSSQLSSQNQSSPSQAPPQPVFLPKPNTVRHKAIDVLTSALAATTSSPAKRRQQVSSRCKPSLQLSPTRVCSPPSATPTGDLPGYSLRYRTVNFREHKPRRRRRSSHGESPQPKALKISGVQGVCREVHSEEVEQDRTESGVETSAAPTVSTVNSQEGGSGRGELDRCDRGTEESGEGGEGVDEGSATLPCTKQGSGRVQPAASSACPPARKHVRLTDRATGQEEDLTPLSSPGDGQEKSHTPTTSTQVLLPPPALHHSLSTRPPEASPSVPPTLAPTPPGLSHSSSPPAATPAALTMLQRSLEPALLCPLPLPAWLVSTMTRLQAMTNVKQPAKDLRGKKRNPRCPIQRAKTQKPHSYANVNWERLLTGQLFLSTVVSMFADDWNCPSPSDLISALIKHLQCSYSPRIEDVVSVYHQLCDDVRANAIPLDPSSPSFPSVLLKAESQVTALLLHTATLNPAMSTLLREVAQALHTAAVCPTTRFHRMAAICRLFTAVCRLLGEKERVLFLCCDLFRRPLSAGELPVIIGMAAVWPAAFARQSGVDLVVNHRLQPAGVEQQPLSYAVEVVTTVMMRQGNLSEHHMKNMHTLCIWSYGQSITIKTADKLVKVLLQLLQTSRNVFVELIPCKGWCRPRPSPLTFHLVHSLRLLAWFKGWLWTSDVLIRAHLWPILQNWNTKKDSVPEATVMAVVRLLGFIGQQGATSDAGSSNSITQLHKLLFSLLLKPHESPISIQLSAAESLLDLCPPSHPSSHDATSVLLQWLKGLSRQPAGPDLQHEFQARLNSYLLNQSNKSS